MSYQKFTKDIGLLGLTQVITALSSIITLPIITKLLGAQNYGIWAQLLVTIALVSSFALINLPYALIRFLPGEKDKQQIQDGVWSAFTIAFAILIVIDALLIFFSNTISKIFGCNQILILFLCPIVMFECLNYLLYNVFRAFQETRKYCYNTIASRTTETMLIIFTVFSGYGLTGAVISMLISRIIFFIIMTSLVIKRVGIKIPKFLKTKEYLSYCLPLVPVDVSYWVIQSSDKYFVGFFLGTIFVGYYAPAYILGCCISFFVTPLGFLLPAILSKHHDENEINTVKTYLRYSLKYFLLLAIPAVFGLSAMARQLLSTFSTPEIAQHSYFVVPFVALSMLLAGVGGIVTQNLLIKKKTKISGSIWIITAFLNFGLNFMFVPYFGILGAAITTLIAYTFVTTLGWYYSFKELAFEIDWKAIYKIIFASAIMSFFVFLIKPVGLYRELITAALGVLIYGTLIILLKGLSIQEINFFKKIFKDDRY